MRNDPFYYSVPDLPSLVLSHPWYMATFFAQTGWLLQPQLSHSYFRQKTKGESRKGKRHMATFLEASCCGLWWALHCPNLPAMDAGKCNFYLLSLKCRLGSLSKKGDWILDRRAGVTAAVTGQRMNCCSH